MVGHRPLEASILVRIQARQPHCMNRKGCLARSLLETVGPAKHDLAKVGLWPHDEQRDGKCMDGTELYDHLIVPA